MNRLASKIFDLVRDWANLTRDDVNFTDGSDCKLPVESCYRIDNNAYLGKVKDKNFFLLFCRIEGRFQVVEGYTMPREDR